MLIILFIWMVGESHGSVSNYYFGGILGSFSEVYMRVAYDAKSL